MPIPALLALIIAFALPLEIQPGAWTPTDPATRLLGILAGFLAMAFASVVVGAILGRRVASRGPSASRRATRWLTHGLDLLALLVYAVFILELDWPGLIRNQMGLSNWILVDEALIYLPFLVLQGITWWGLLPVDLASRAWRRASFPPPTRLRTLTLRFRQTYGLLLPVAALFSTVQEITDQVSFSPGSAPWIRLAGYALLCGLLVVGSPALIRLTWPTRPLPEGPLRDRLEQLAARYRFRFTDILLWDTGGIAINAGVTGAVPWFRYVLLTDALVENLEPRQIEAVFGHEVGHVVHRHLPFFATFFLGSIGVMSLMGLGVERILGWADVSWPMLAQPPLDLLVEAAIALSAAGLYFLLLFGFLSRRFERQADVFGCRSVSCGRPQCPPHLDVNAAAPESAGPESLCPVGVRLFIDALTTVALCNGLELNARSWRHGSIARRIEFLEGLEFQPHSEGEFQRGIRRLRLAVLALLAITMLGAYWAGALEAL